MMNVGPYSVCDKSIHGDLMRYLLILKCFFSLQQRHSILSGDYNKQRLKDAREHRRLTTSVLKEFRYQRSTPFFRMRREGEHNPDRLSPLRPEMQNEHIYAFLNKMNQILEIKCRQKTVFAYSKCFSQIRWGIFKLKHIQENRVKKYPFLLFVFRLRLGFSRIFCEQHAKGFLFSWLFQYN